MTALLLETAVKISFQNQLSKSVVKRGCIKGWDARRAVKFNPQQPVGCEDLNFARNAADRLLGAPSKFKAEARLHPKSQRLRSAYAPWLVIVEIIPHARVNVDSKKVHRREFQAEAGL